MDSDGDDLQVDTLMVMTLASRHSDGDDLQVDSDGDGVRKFFAIAKNQFYPSESFSTREFSPRCNSCRYK